MTGLRSAITLLTRIPLRDEAEPERAAAWFSLVGAVVGLAVAGVYAVLFPWLPSLLAAVVAVAAGVWLTGAFHEDGLADSFDALGSSATGEEALRIMRDSRLGTYGTTALVFSLLWRTVAVASLTTSGALAGLVAAHALGRMGAMALMSLTPPARDDGLGRSGTSGVTPRAAGLAIGTGLGLAAVAAGWWVGPAVIGTVAVIAILRRVAMRRVGGVTGDILGAAEQLTEMIVLAVVAAAAWQGWTPWWVG